MIWGWMHILVAFPAHDEIFHDLYNKYCKPAVPAHGVIEGIFEKGKIADENTTRLRFMIFLP